MITWGSSLLPGTTFGLEQEHGMQYRLTRERLGTRYIIYKIYN